MPGILYHLSFAELVFQKLKEMGVSIDKTPFMCGNLIPDLAVDKKLSHFRKNASIDGFFVPDMEKVKKCLLIKDNPIKFGMYCHLYLDYYFIEKFLIPEFIWDYTNKKVINPRTHKEWDVKTFFSHSGMYGSYTEINQLLIRDGHVSMTTVNSLPEILPATGLPIFDERRELTWKAELEKYLAQKKDYTGEVFDYDRLWNSIEEIATQLVKEVS